MDVFGGEESFIFELVSFEPTSSIVVLIGKCVFAKNTILINQQSKVNISINPISYNSITTR